MSEPLIFAVDDDPQVLRALSRDLRQQYRQKYRILSTTSPQEALDSLTELKNKGEVVALFISDQRMPVMEGVEFLKRAAGYFPDAKKVLLTAYSDTDAAIRAINDIQLDYYLMKPWNPPEEKLYPVINDLLDDWQSHYQPEFKGIKVIGYQFSPASHEIKGFLAGNLVPYKWLDVETDREAKHMVEINQLNLKDTPVVIFEDGEKVCNPSIRTIATHIGLTPEVKNEVYDVVIIGAGPAGLSAAVYGGSEGLKTLLIERRAPGGQAGTSSRIENYLGFPSGLSGADLTRRAVSQAARFGTELLSPQSVKDIRLENGYKMLVMEDDTVITTRSVVITTGVDYRKLEVKGVEQFTGAGIYYGAATTEATACSDKEVYIIGGGNSAGQGAMYLSKFASKVYIIIRRSSLAESMSAYLIDQISKVHNIELLPETEIVEALGDMHLEQLTLKDNHAQENRTVKADALYIFIGAKPYTEWIKLDIIKNDKGFIETGRNMQGYASFTQIWKQKREPYLLETSCAGIFAAGDVRAGAMNRVASAVGEGSMCINFIHKYLAEV